MQFLIYFVLGILFYIIIIPIIDSLVSLVETAIEVKKYKLSVKIAEYTKQVKDLTGKDIDSQAIGFSYDFSEDEDEEDEEEDEE